MRSLEGTWTEIFLLILLYEGGFFVLLSIVRFLVGVL